MMILEQKVGGLPVYVFENRAEMGKAAAKEAGEQIRALIAKKGEANVIFAAAPSQGDMLSALLEEDIDWTKVRAFYQDEYIGLDPSHPAGFGNFLRRHIWDLKPFKGVHSLECKAEDAEAKMAEYAALLNEHPPDLMFLGVGENGHLAFNDPPYAEFKDPKVVKSLPLDLTSRQQQVNDGCFASLDEVPTHAMTLTMSLILGVPSAIVVVPTKLKANAIDAALNGPITEDCPASALRMHPNAKLYLDKDSAAKGFAL